MNSYLLINRLIIRFCLFIIIVFSFNIDAKQPNADLNYLCKNSDVIILGKIQWVGSTKERSYFVFIEEQLKGGKVHVEKLPLCVVKKEDSEGPVYIDDQRMVLFLQRHDDCFSAILGYRRSVRFENKRALTIAIQGEPDWQPEKRFLESIRACPGATSEDSE